MTAFSTPPRFQLPELRSPLANDPLMSANTPSRGELRLLDEQSHVNGYPVKFLLHVVGRKELSSEVSAAIAGWKNCTVRSLLREGVALVVTFLLRRVAGTDSRLN